jgi:hypothetical protein
MTLCRRSLLDEAKIARAVTVPHHAIESPSGNTTARMPD